MGTKVNRHYYDLERDGFYGAFYECPSGSDKAMILMLGDSIDDRMAVSGVKWLHQQGCHVMAMSPDKKDYGHHNYPLERFGKAIGVCDVSVKNSMIKCSTDKKKTQKKKRRKNNDE